MRRLLILGRLSAMAALLCAVPALAAPVASSPPSVRQSARMPPPGARISPDHERLQPRHVGKVEVLSPRRAPATAREHEALARKYQENATTYHQVADVQRDLLAILKTGPSETSPTVSQEAARVRKHTTELIRDAERLAAQAQKAADDQHRLAQELSRP